MFDRKISPKDFVARGKLESDGISIPVIVHGTYNPYVPLPVSCTISPDGRRKSIGHVANFDKIEVKAVTNEGEEVRILGLEQVTISHIGSKTLWKGIASYFIKGKLKRFSSTGSEIHCSVFIPFTPLARAEITYTNSFDGTISIGGKEKREGIKWKTSFGTAELIDNYYYAYDKVGVDKTTIRIRRCQAYLVIKPKGQFSLENLMRELPNLFDETFRLISFLSRKRITWYAAEALAFPKKGNLEFRQAVSYKQSWLGFQGDQEDEQTWLDVTVKLADLRNGLFEKLHENYLESHYKSIIKRTIPFLMMSYEQGYFESHIANTYSALETMVAGLSSNGDEEAGNALSSKEFRELRKKLEVFIKDNISGEDAREGIIKKLGELNRRPILDRLLFLLRKYDVPVGKIWTSNTDVETELGKIIRRRNLYIHQGRIDDFKQYYDDYSKLRILVELWILRLLDCPDDSINTSAIQVFLAR